MTLPLRSLLRHFNNRISEVVKALIMIGIGVQIMAAPAAEFKPLHLLARFARTDPTGTGRNTGHG